MSTVTVQKTEYKAVVNPTPPSTVVVERTKYVVIGSDPDIIVTRQPERVVAIRENLPSLAVVFDKKFVVIQSPMGPQGAAGPVGSDLTYRHVQGVAATVWNVTHNLSKFPSVTVVDTAGSEVEGKVEHLSNTQARLTFSAAFSGEAFFN